MDEATIHARLAAAAEASRVRDSLRARLVPARDQEAKAVDEVARRRAQLAVEDEQVDKLESFSLTRIVAGVRGTRDSDLTREEAEREAARFAVAAAEARLDHIARDRAALESRLSELADVDAELGRSLAAKEAWVTVGHHPGAERLGQIAQRRGTITAELREGYEAAVAAEGAADLLARAAKQLGSADSWSAYDTWFGGGMFSSAIKHDHMDQAAHLLRSVDGALLVLQRELADVGRSGVAQLDIGGWERTFDIFFDNIFSDLRVRDRVKAAREKVHAARQAVHQVRRDLQTRAEALDAELSTLEAERRALLT